MKYVVGLYKSSLVVDGERRKPGDAVPEAHEWKEHILNAHLKLKWIMTEDEFAYSKKSHDVKEANRRQLLEDKKAALKARAEPQKKLVNVVANLEVVGAEVAVKDGKVEVKPEIKVSVETKPVQTSEPLPLVSSEPGDLNSLDVDALKKICGQMGLDKRGGKKLLLARINATKA